MNLFHKARRKLSRIFCKHDWVFEAARDSRRGWPWNRVFVYVCEKCGARKAINCEDIFQRIALFAKKDCSDYPEKTVLLPNGYGPMLVEYSGQDVGRTVQWYLNHEGVLISAYYYKQAEHHNQAISG